MRFERIIGQDRVKRFFEKAIEGGRLSHAYLLVGNRGVGKEAVALDLAAGLLARGDAKGRERVTRMNHPDLHWIFPAPASAKPDEISSVLKGLCQNPYLRPLLWANPTISIETIRDIRRKASYKSFEGHGKIFVIAEAERMTPEAANSLLKILEEPPDEMYLFMLSSSPNLLLPTILSRCQVVKFDPLSVSEISEALISEHGMDQARARMLARLAGGSYRQALESMDLDLSEVQQEALEFLRKSVQDGYQQVRYVEELLGKWQRDQIRVREMLAHVQIWCRDAELFRADPGTEPHIVNYEQLDVLRKLTDSFADADMQGAVREIERAMELMERNVQLNLILIVLLSKMRTFVRR